MTTERAGLREAHDRVCSCPADGSDPGCNYRLNMADATPDEPGLDESAVVKAAMVANIMYAPRHIHEWAAVFIREYARLSGREP